MPLPSGEKRISTIDTISRARHQNTFFYFKERRASGKDNDVWHGRRPTANFKKKLFFERRKARRKTDHSTSSGWGNLTTRREKPTELVHGRFVSEHVFEKYLELRKRALADPALKELLRARNVEDAEQIFRSKSEDGKYYYFVEKRKTPTDVLKGRRQKGASFQPLKKHERRVSRRKTDTKIENTQGRATTRRHAVTETISGRFLTEQQAFELTELAKAFQARK